MCMRRWLPEAGVTRCSVALGSVRFQALPVLANTWRGQPFSWWRFEWVMLSHFGVYIFPVTKNTKCFW